MRRSIFWVMIFASLIISLIILRSTSAHEFAASIHVWKSYTNIRYQYALCYPEDLLIPQGESPNNDGQTFLAEDGAQLVVFGQNNALKESLKGCAGGHRIAVSKSVGQGNV